VTPFALIFITRPKLFIKTSPNDNNILENIAYKNMALHPYLSRFTDENVQNEKHKIAANLLSYYGRSSLSNMNFIPIFTNKTRSFNVDLNTTSTAEQGATKHGFRHIYPTHNVGSMSNGVLSFELNEMHDLEISTIVGI